MTDFGKDLDLTTSFDDELEPELYNEHMISSMVQFANEQQTHMADNSFYGNLSVGHTSKKDIDDSLLDDTDISDSQSIEDTNYKSNSSTKLSFQDIKYDKNDLLPSIKPSFIKQYYIRFTTNICLNLVFNTTVQRVLRRNSDKYSQKYLGLAKKLNRMGINDMDSSLAKGIINEVKRVSKRNEGRLVYFHSPTLSKFKLNNRQLPALTQHDIILPVFDDVFTSVNKQVNANSLLNSYNLAYLKLPVSTNEYADDFDPHNNPQYDKKITSLQQSINFLKTSCWYYFSSEINSLFANKRNKPLSLSRGYIAMLITHYNNSSIYFEDKLLKNLGSYINLMTIWVEKMGTHYLNLTDSSPQLSRRYSNQTISVHQLNYQLLKMLSVPIIKPEPLDNLNYDLDTGALYLAGLNEVYRLWIMQLSMIHEQKNQSVLNLRHSLLKTASRKARTFYPPSAIVLED